MNEASVKYLAYKALLEGEITQDQYNLISEINFLKMLGIKGGAMLKAMKAASGTLSDTYGNEKLQGVQDAASTQMQKLIKQIRQIANDNEMDENQFVGVVATILKKAFADAGISDPKTIFAAFDKGAPEVASSVTASSSGESEAASGSPVTSSTIKDEPAAAIAIASDAAPDKEKEIKAAAEAGKLDADALSQLMSVAASKETGVSQDVAQKIVLALIDAGRLLKEGKRMNLSVRARNILESTSRSDVLILEKWHKIAGIKGGLLEEGADADVLVANIKDKKIKTVKDFIDTVTNLKDDKAAIADIEKSKSKIVAAVEGDVSFQGFDKRFDEIIKDLKGGQEPDVSPEDKKDEPVKGDAPAVGDDVMKKLKPVLDDIRKKINAEEASDDDVIKVIKYIDGLKAAKVKGGA